MTNAYRGAVRWGRDRIAWPELERELAKQQKEESGGGPATPQTASRARDRELRRLLATARANLEAAQRVPGMTLT
jgi:hypothetical protein